MGEQHAEHGKRHEARGIGGMLGECAPALVNRGLPLAQELIAGGELRLPGTSAAELAARLPQLTANARLRALAAVRAHARESITLGDAHWREIHCEINAVDNAGEDGSLVRVRLVLSGMATRSLGGDALAGTAAALTSLAREFPWSVIDDLRILAIDIEGRARALHCEALPADVAARLPEQRAALARTRCAVITLSDRAANGVYEDKSGALLARIVSEAGGSLVHQVVLPDDGERLAIEVEVLSRRGDIDLVICTGGTGIGPRDITPETLLRLGIRPIPGIGELLRAHSANVVRSAWLSRSVAGTLGTMIVIALPGSQKAVAECMEVLLPLLPHTLSMLHGGAHG